MVSEKQQVNAVNDSTITSSISWWHGWHLFHCISPMSLQDRTIFTDKQHLATDLARLPRTVSPGEQWCKLICERSEWFHKNKFDIMMAWMTPVSLHFSNVSTGSNNLYRLTTLGYWFSTFATNSLSRRTVVQINFCPPHHLESSRIYGTKKFNKVRQHHLESSRNAVSSCIILDFQTENTIREFDTWDGHHCRTPWCCKLHASHRSQRKHPQRYNEPNSLVTSTTSCTNLLHTRTIQCKECVLRSLRPRLLRLTSKHHCRIDMQTEQWSSLWTYQFPHRLPHQTNQAPHVLARIH